MEMLKLRRLLTTPDAIPPAPTDLPSLDAQERELIWPFFTADHAWFICTGLRDILHKMNQHAVIDISLVASDRVLAHTATNGTVPDNDRWVERKRRTVVRWGHSSWYMRQKYKGDEKAFRERSGLGEEEGRGYAIHGGAFPVRVKGVEGVVAVVVVSGLRQEMDHQIVVEVLRAALKDEREVAEMRKKGVETGALRSG